LKGLSVTWKTQKICTRDLPGLAAAGDFSLWTWRIERPKSATFATTPVSDPVSCKKKKKEEEEERKKERKKERNKHPFDPLLRVTHQNIW